METSNAHNSKSHDGIISMLLGMLSFAAVLSSIWILVEPIKILLTILGIVFGFIGFRLAGNVLAQVSLLGETDNSISQNEWRFAWLGKRFGRAIVLLIGLFILIALLGLIAYSWLPYRYSHGIL